jgi:hypothetical protein
MEEDDKDPLNLLGLNKLFDEFVDQMLDLGWKFQHVKVLAQTASGIRAAPILSVAP